jgi:hypothetical protein
VGILGLRVGDHSRIDVVSKDDYPAAGSRSLSWREPLEDFDLIGKARAVSKD